LPVDGHIAGGQRWPGAQGLSGEVAAIFWGQKVTNAFAGAYSVLAGQLYGGFYRIGGMISVQHEHIDEILDALRLSLGLAKALQKNMKGFRPTLPPLPNRPRAMEGPRPLLNQLKIMIRMEAPLVVAVHPLVMGDPFVGSQTE
jgi:hypothetical protein